MLYRLKQGARNWYDALSKALSKLGFVHTEVDQGIFVKRSGTDSLFLAIHVDDCLITGTSASLIKAFKVEMNKKYKLTDLGPVEWLLGIKVTRNRAERMISLSQHAYIDSIITRFNFNDLKPSSIPMNPYATLSKSQCPTKFADI